MKRTIVSFAGFGTALALLAAVPGAGLAQMGGKEQKCVGTLLKDGYKLEKARARQMSDCLEGAQDGSVADLTACLDGTAGDKVADASARVEEDAVKRCSGSPATFGVPAAFDDTIVEAGLFHSRGLAADLLGDTPAAAGTDDGDACQATALAQAQKLRAAYGKAFTKCVATALKEGAADDAPLSACLASVDVAKAQEKLADAVGKDCAGVAPLAVLPGDCSGASDATLAACVTARARCRACRQAATFASVDSDCDMVDDAADNDSCSFPVTVSGNAFNFSNYSRLVGSVVWVLEHPTMTTLTDGDGYFEFAGLEEGEEVSLVLEDPGYHPIQNGTIRPGPNGAERVTFQAVNWATYDALADFLGIVPDELGSCQMVTTVTRVGKSIYDPGAHGQAFTTVSLDPPVSADHGPIYFNSAVLPDITLDESSDDGGVLYVQMAPGEYVWTGHWADKIFTRVKSKCRAGLLVNASPPWGLQLH